MAFGLRLGFSLPSVQPNTPPIVIRWNRVPCRAPLVRRSRTTGSGRMQLRKLLCKKPRTSDTSVAAATSVRPALCGCPRLLAVTAMRTLGAVRWPRPTASAGTRGGMSSWRKGPGARVAVRRRWPRTAVLLAFAINQKVRDKSVDLWPLLAVWRGWCALVARWQLVELFRPFLRRAPNKEVRSYGCAVLLRYGPSGAQERLVVRPAPSAVIDDFAQWSGLQQLRCIGEPAFPPSRRSGWWDRYRNRSARPPFKTEYQSRNGAPLADLPTPGASKASAVASRPNAVVRYSAIG